MVKAVTPIPFVKARFFDRCGKPLTGGKIYTYEANTTTAKTTYKDPYGLTPNTNPIILDAAGEADIYLDGTYRIRITDRNDVLVNDVAKIGSWFSDNLQDTLDNISGAMDEALKPILQNLDDVINTAAAAGAGANGWSDTLIAVSNGRNQREKNAEQLSVKDFGAVGDGTLHKVSEWTVSGVRKYYKDLAAIQVDYPHVTSLDDAIDWAAAQKSLNDLNYAYFPHSKTRYVINKTLVINQFFARVYSTSMQTTVLNVGTADMFEVKKDFATFENISLYGNGTTTVHGSGRHGIYFNFASYFTFNRVGVRYHGGHGVYGFNGVVTGKFINSEIEVNWLDGVNVISPTTAAASQNGNAMSLINTVCSLNKGAGIRWWGAALNISGSNFEKNSDTGIAIDATNVDVTKGTVSAFGINIAGNYFEHNGANGAGQIKITSKLGAAFSGGHIAGNWMYSSNSGGLIQVAGPYRGVKKLTVSGNSGYRTSGATIIVDGGNALDESCLVVVDITETANLGLATQIGGYKKCVITGATSAKGVAWTNIAGASDNFFNNTTDVTVDIAIPAYLANTLVNNIKFIVETDATTQYSQDVYLYAFDPLSTSYTLTSVASGTFSSETSGGNTTISLNNYTRLDGTKAYILRIIFKKMTSGTIRKMHNVAVTYAQ